MNQINGKYYYGVHNGKNTESYEGSGDLLYKAYKKYGKENFKKEILKEFDTEDEAYEYEEVIVNEKMINKNNPMCYNLKEGGKGFTSDFAREIALKRIEEGTHNWQNMTDIEKSNRSKKSCQTQVKNGTFSLLNLSPESETNRIQNSVKKRLENNPNAYVEIGKKGIQSQMAAGTHSSQVKNKCPYCNFETTKCTLTGTHIPACHFNPNSHNYLKPITRDYTIKRYQEQGLQHKVDELNK
jgi:hypothetical protein